MVSFLNHQVTRIIFGSRQKTRSTEIEYLEKREPGDLILFPPANVYYLFAGAIPAQVGGLNKLT